MNFLILCMPFLINVGENWMGNLTKNGDIQRHIKHWTLDTERRQI